MTLRIAIIVSVILASMGCQTSVDSVEQSRAGKRSRDENSNPVLKSKALVPGDIELKSLETSDKRVLRLCYLPKVPPEKWREINEKIITGDRRMRAFYHALLLTLALEYANGSTNETQVRVLSDKIAGDKTQKAVWFFDASITEYCQTCFSLKFDGSVMDLKSHDHKWVPLTINSWREWWRAADREHRITDLFQAQRQWKTNNSSGDSLGDSGDAPPPKVNEER
jgi:hypothetical protein